MPYLADPEDTSSRQRQIAAASMLHAFMWVLKEADYISQY